VNDPVQHICGPIESVPCESLLAYQYIAYMYGSSLCANMASFTKREVDNILQHQATARQGNTHKDLVKFEHLVFGIC